MQLAAATVAAAGRRYIALTHPIIHQPCTAFGIGGIRDELLSIRNWLLTGSLVENVVDIWRTDQWNDTLITNKRCNNNVNLVCASNADCTGFGAACVAYPSTLRPWNDEVHRNSRGALVIGNTVAAYLNMLSPACSGDLTTGCGRCSVTTATACISSIDCPSSEKCRFTNSVCSGAGKGTCSLERACNTTSSCVNHHLCSRDLSTRCTSDADCTAGKGLCRPEGHLQPGEG
jgi:hypothetical protein